VPKEPSNPSRKKTKKTRTPNTSHVKNTQNSPNSSTIPNCDFNTNEPNRGTNNNEEEELKMCHEGGQEWVGRDRSGSISQLINSQTFYEVDHENLHDHEHLGGELHGLDGAEGAHHIDD
jgi:hypothetical protein